MGQNEKTETVRSCSNNRSADFRGGEKARRVVGVGRFRRKATELSTWVLRSRTGARRHLHPKNASSFEVDKGKVKGGGQQLTTEARIGSTGCSSL